MVGLGVVGDTPPNNLQPTLEDGIHMRWAFKLERGFPWYGYYLFRRDHEKGRETCVNALFCANKERPPFKPGRWKAPTLDTPYGRYSSDRELVLTDDFPQRGVLELDLDERKYVRFDLPVDEVARRVEVTIGFRRDASVVVVAEIGGVPVARATAKGRAGQIVQLTVASDMIDAVVLGRAPAALIDICFVLAAQEATQRWQPLAGFRYPMSLPVAHVDYPCPGAPTTATAAQTLGIGRVRYGASAPFNAAFPDLHTQLRALVAGGPAGTPMAQRFALPIVGTPVTPDPGLPTPTLAPQRYLEILTLAALNPALAQILGLYWIDKTATRGRSYDYLIVADHKGVGGGTANGMLAHVQASGFAQVDAYIAYNLVFAPSPPLSAPTDARSYALPSGTFRAQGGQNRNATNNAGVRWMVPLNSGVLVAGSALMYHVWRAACGNGQQPTAATTYQAITRSSPVLVVRSNLPTGATPQRATDWPPFSLHTIDRGLTDGWYSYQVSGIDIFGRHSVNSGAASWYQWAPRPDPKPWYYQDPASDTAVHPWAVRLIDRAPPPMPTAVEAYALDPGDPTVLKDAVYQSWLSSLSTAERTSVIGLRVRWQWTDAHMLQAPDTNEFRIYFNSGTDPPTNRDRPTSWSERFYVAPYSNHVTVITDANGRPVRKYEVILPASGDAYRGGVPLTPTTAASLLYANVGVAAADDKAYVADDPIWATGRWGGRTGNEGPVGPPGKIFVVKRTPPDPPRLPPADGERVFATPADYHSRSFFTYRWIPTTGLKTHILRAMDEAVFLADWRQRPRQALTAAQTQFFPDATVEARWDQAKRLQVATELNALNAMTKAQAFPYYRGLSNDALRVLAGLPGVEQAFVQLTIQPLDPAQTANANRVGPDNPAGYAVNASLRAYVDTLDGRSSNRYFYRAAYVDAVHNRGGLSLSSPPVWLADLRQPEPPRLLPALAGQRRVRVRWTLLDDPSLRRYRVFRSETADDARDLRSMTQVADVPARALVSTAAEVDLGTGTDIATAERVYAAAAFKPDLDLLTGQSAAQYLAAPAAPTGTRVTALSAPNGTAVVVVYRDSRQGLQYTPYVPWPVVWTDEGAPGARDRFYRVVAVRQGFTAAANVLIPSSPSDIARGRAIDLSPPAPPTIGTIQWVRVDEAGLVYPYAAAVPVGVIRSPAVRLVWTAADPDLTCLVQVRQDPAGAFASASAWLPHGSYQFVHRNNVTFQQQEYRIKVLSRSGNANATFAPVTLAPPP